MAAPHVRLVVVALCAAIGCAYRVRPIASPGTERLDAAVASLSSRAEYSTGATPDAVRGGELAEELARRIRAHFDKLSLEGSGKMADIATRVAGETERIGRSPGAAELDAIARDAGFVGPSPSVFVFPRTGGGWDRLDEYLAMSPDNIHFTHYGAVVLDLGGALVGAVALGAENVKIDPVPRRVPTSSRIRVHGSLASGYSKAEIAWTRPDGSTRRTPAGDGQIEFETPPLELGVHRVEILAVGNSGIEVLANMPIACGVDMKVVTTPSEVVDESNPKAALFELLNRERKRAGLPPLEGDRSLDEVAEGHSKDMVEAHFFGHKSPTTGVVEDRLRAHGMRLGLLGENVAKGPSMADSHAMLMASPAHRANVLNPSFTHVGIGVVEERSRDPRLYAVTEVFAGLPKPIADPDGAAREVLGAVNRLRARSKAPELASAPALDAVAREIADGVSGTIAVSPSVVAEPILRTRLSGSRFRRPLLLMGFPLEPAELSHDERLRGVGLRYGGVAVVQSPPGGRPMTNIVVIVLAE